MKFKKAASLVFILLGCALITASVSLLLYNRYDSNRAGKAADKVLSELEEVIARNTAAHRAEASSREERSAEESEPSAAPPESAAPHESAAPPAVKSGENPVPAAGPPRRTETPPPEDFGMMPEVEIDGKTYIGVLTIPTIGVTLPVCGYLDYSGLRVAPCRQFGTVEDNNIVIAGHNYSAHFFRLHKLQSGEPVFFTDVNGEVTEYAVGSVDIMPAYAESVVRNSEWDMVLYTCTYSMRERIVVGCVKLPPEDAPPMSFFRGA